MNVDEDISLEQLSTWKVDSLRSFLLRRGLSTDGNKSELTALCYAAAKMKISVKPSEDEYFKQNAKDYENLLHIDGIIIPDPLKLCDGWVDETEGISVWPPVFLSDIANFLMSNNDKPTTTKYLNDYKIGKAYEYFSSKWIKEVFFHRVSRESVYCFLRAKCTPSQRLNEEEHTVWTCINKETGVIRSAYCSCTAGLGQTCSHVAGLLFRLEAANKLGLSACTSLPCTWDIPRTKDIKARPISEITIKKSRHGKDHSRPLVSKEKIDYKPLQTPTDGKKLINSLIKVLPNSVLRKGIEVPAEAVLEVKSMVCREASATLIEDLQMHNIQCETSSDLAENQPILSDSDISFVNKATIGQSQNVNWHKLRHGRLTASNAYNIYTRVNTHHENPNTDMTSLVSTVMGYTTPNPNLKPLKFGRESEPIAKAMYKNEYEKSHTETSFSECGIFLDANNSYLAASPDLLVSCSCCGNGLLEVKAIMVPKCSSCFSFCTCKLPSFLYDCNNSLNVKKNHSYFCQMQVQMALTHRNWCDLFVYSVNGSFKERIYFDKEYYDKVFINLKYFFKTFVAPEVLSRNIQKSQSVSQSVESLDVEANTYFCIMCNCQIQEQENIKSFGERSICCDMCDRWYHFKCVNMTKATLSKIKDWICQACNQSLP